MRWSCLSLVEAFVKLQWLFECWEQKTAATFKASTCKPWATLQLPIPAGASPWLLPPTTPVVWSHVPKHGTHGQISEQNVVQQHYHTVFSTAFFPNIAWPKGRHLCISESKTSFSGCLGAGSTRPHDRWEDESTAGAQSKATRSSHDTWLATTGIALLITKEFSKRLPKICEVPIPTVSATLNECGLRWEVQIHPQTFQDRQIRYLRKPAALKEQGKKQLGLVTNHILTSDGILQKKRAPKQRLVYWYHGPESTLTDQHLTTGRSVCFFDLPNSFESMPRNVVWLENKAKSWKPVILSGDLFESLVNIHWGVGSENKAKKDEKELGVEPGWNLLLRQLSQRSQLGTRLHLC